MACAATPGLLDRNYPDSDIGDFAEWIFTHVLFDGKYMVACVWEANGFLDELLMRIYASTPAAQPTAVGFGKLQFEPLRGIPAVGVALMQQHENVGVLIVRRMPQIEVYMITCCRIGDVGGYAGLIVIIPYMVLNGDMLVQQGVIRTGCRKGTQNQKEPKSAQILPHVVVNQFDRFAAAPPISPSGCCRGGVSAWCFWSLRACPLPERSREVRRASACFCRIGVSFCSARPSE